MNTCRDCNALTSGHCPQHPMVVNYPISTPTTVSACKEGHKKDCDMYSNVGIPSAQKDESYCTCGKTTKVKATVEKWGGDQESNKCEFCGQTKPVQRYYLSVKNKHFDDNKSGYYSTFIYYCQDCGVEDTHSVQEAKAEMSLGRNWYFEGDELVITRGKWVIDRYKKHASLKKEEGL